MREERLSSGDVLLHVLIQFVAVGKRKERDRKDIYKIAETLVDKLDGKIDLDTSHGGDESA